MAAANQRKTKSNRASSQGGAKTAPSAKTTGKEGGGRTSQKAKTPPARPRTRDHTLRPEILSIACIAVGLLLMLSLYTASGGVFGAFIQDFLTGLFGFGAYFMPMIVVGASLFVLLGAEKRIAPLKIVMSLLLFWCVIAFVHIVNLPKDAVAVADAIEYIKEAYITGGASNGGLFGAMLGDLLGKVFGGGKYIVLVTLGIVSLIILTGRSLIGLVLRIGDWIEERRALAAERREQMAEGEYDDYVEYDEDEPVITDGGRPIPARALPGEGRKRRVFDHVIDGEGGRGDVPEERIHLVNADEKDYHRIFGAKDKKEAEAEPARQLSMREYAEQLDGAVNEEPQPEDGAEAQADDESISVRGIGVEGYTPTAVGADGETFVPTGKAKDRDKILEEMSAIEKAARSALDGGTPIKEYELPSIDLLTDNPYVPSLSSKAMILENSRKLEETLKSFGVEARVVEVSKGPTVTRYELSPGPGVKVSKISGLADDLALSLAAVGIRIEAPIPGKSVVGIEIPNKEVQSVYLKEVLGDNAFWSYPSKLSVAIGKDIAGNTVIADIAKMPHLLIAGATGSGKSVCINTLITSILYKAHPDEVKLLMIDPKVVELSIYNGIPHLIIPVVTDPKKASGALNWAVREMDLRYNTFAETHTRDLKGYNAWRANNGELPIPQIVVIVDELADLMMAASGEVEEAICRLAQKARAAGIHLVIATQRPSVDVITGLIKANVPSRLAFAVSSGIDSRTILDSVGAEKLLGRGDMLFSPAGLSKPQRIQGAFISDDEVAALVAFIKAQGEHEYDPAMVEKVTSNVKEEVFGGEEDEFLQDAIEFLVEKEKASVSVLQRRFRIGYNRASRLMEDLENRGIVGPEDGSKPRKVLMTRYQLGEYKERRESMAAGEALAARQAAATAAAFDEPYEEEDDDAPF